MPNPRPSHWWFYPQMGGLLTLMSWLYAPAALQLAKQWWRDPNYTHGFFVPVFSLFLLWDRREKLSQVPLKPSWSGLPLLLVALFALVLGAISSQFFLTRLSFVLLICGLVVFLAGWRHLAAISFPLAFLALMSPSSTVLNQITLPLQMVASKTAAALLSMIGIPVWREGNILLLPSTRLEVAEACSGVRSLFSLITLATIYGYLAESRIGLRIGLALLAVPVSVLANALRITVTGLAVEFWGVQSAEGTPHLISGWLIFTASLAAIFLLHRAAQTVLLRFQADEAEASA